MKHAFILAALAVGYAQTPAFELASIKPADPAIPMSIRRSGHRIVTTNTSLLFLITWAYDIHSDHLINKPGFLDSVRFDVIAGAPLHDGPTPSRKPGQPTELQQMMQSLLADRFDLKLHRETREMSVYALVLAKGGPKLTLTKAPDVFGQNPFSVPGPGRLIGTQVSTAMLANVLRNQLDRSVQDQTGLTGVFDFKLEGEPDGTSLFTALQEQLGLKLEARKGPVEVLVIDHLESKPKEN